MVKKEKRGKNIAEEIRNKNCLVSNVGYYPFLLGYKISSFFYLQYERDEKKDEYDYDSYFFDDYNVNIWCDRGIIKVIRCNKYCWYKGRNLIGMNIDDFSNLITYKPSRSEVIYVHKCYKHNGENQTVYDYDNEGLQVWVWRNKIDTILITKKFEE